MNREDIIRMADEAKNQWPIEPDFLERFAALVIANHPPQSYMTWQEGYEAGKQTERDACAKIGDDHPSWSSRMYSATIRARGDKHD